MEEKKSVKDKYSVKPIQSEQCKEWLLWKHYLHRLPMIIYAIGLYDETKNQIGVITFGMPPNPSLCVGICGKEYKDKVFELNRLVVNDGLYKNVLSYFVSSALNMLPKPMIIVSYAEKDFGHNGYIYQATNFIYTGLSAKRTDPDHGKDVTHNRTSFVSGLPQKERPRKHRYIYFLGSKTEVKKMKQALLYKIEPYPKGENKRYDSSYAPLTQQSIF